MIYCEQCGAANDIMNEQCYRCGHQLASVAKPLVQATGNASTGQSTSHDIGQSLELPDWLKRAAAETPAASPPTPSAAQQMPPPGFRVAETGAAPTTDDLFRAETSRPAPAPAPRPLPPVPTAGLPTTMPDWLKSQPPQQPRTPESDVTDTTSFISENDLPEWIRQIAEADAAKKADEEHLAAEAARKTEVAGPKQVVLPGESSPSVPASNPWLSRRDGVSAARSWGAVEPPVAATSANEIEPAAAQAEVVATEYGVPPVAAPDGRKGLKLNKPSVTKPSFPKLSLPSAKRGSSTSSSPQNLRVILLAALVILLVLVAIGMLL